MTECDKREMYEERDKKVKKFRKLIIEFLGDKEENGAYFKEIIDFLKEKLGKEFRNGYGILNPEFEDDERIVKFNVLKYDSKHFDKRREETIVWYSLKKSEA